jgi:hypothetical protein
VERRRADTALERRRAARLAERSATATAPAKPKPAEPKDSPAPRTTPATRQSSDRTRSAAARRAYARRAQRTGRRPEHSEHAEQDRAAGRASFVILIIALLAVGVAATLWLSTQAIADSYRLEHAKQEADQLAERADQLQRDVTKAESASALAERARAMGMVPAGDPARLVVKPNGRVVVVGEPTKVRKPKPPRQSAEASPDQQRPANAQEGG